jgi:hypothetical protein
MKIHGRLGVRIHAFLPVLVIVYSYVHKERKKKERNKEKMEKQIHQRKKEEKDENRGKDRVGQKEDKEPMHCVTPNCAISCCTHLRVPLFASGITFLNSSCGVNIRAMAT